MIKLENVEVFGFETAIRGMRNAMNSWTKIDSKWGCNDPGGTLCTGDCGEWCTGWNYIIGKNDLALMKKLAKAGNDHGKFARMINVTLDITSPLYWWKEFDTYKVGTVANSCSTMHKIHTTPITPDIFSFDHVKLCEIGKAYLDELEKLRVKFNDTGDKKYWYALIQLLPESYNQRRTVQFNYQVLWSMYQRRKDHKLDEWREFCKWVETLPYFKEIYLEE